MRYFHFPVDVVSPEIAFSAFADDPYSIFFDSSDPDHPLSHSSYICVNPVEIIESRGNKILVRNKDQSLTLTDNPLRFLKERLALWVPDGSIPGQVNNVHRFRGGVAGYFGYDLGREFEQIPVRAERMDDVPDMAVGIYMSVLAFNHQHPNKNMLYILANDQSDAEAKAGLVLEKLRRTKDRSQAITSAEIRPSVPEATFKEKIQKVLDYIFAGDIFQANLSLQFQGRWPEKFDPYAHYLKLRRINKAPFGSYLNFGHVKISSVSPEGFLDCHNKDVITRPIKGTCARHPDEEINQEVKDFLRNDEKSRAENAMIVDLMRNDLSRACTDHSVHVASLFDVETYARVNHMISTVEGRLRPDKGPIDLLQDCFPGGSITGAPKIRAMEIIEELEPRRRGPYCGSVGFVGFDGTMGTNIAIRTILHRGEDILMNVGAGIVADSKVESEYAEIMAKAKGLLDSFEEESSRNDLLEEESPKSRVEREPISEEQDGQQKEKRYA